MLSPRRFGQVLTAIVTLVAAASAASAAPPEKGLGINITGVHPGAPTLPFVDVFKQSSGWIATQRGSVAKSNEALALDRDGWVTYLAPGQEATTLVLTGRAFPAGQYTAAYDGQGRLTFGLDATAVDSGRNQVLLRVRPRDGIRLTITETDPNDPLRNISLYLPGYRSDRGAPLFNPRYLAFLKGFRVIRFVGWINANENDVADWENRTRVEQSSQSGRNGVALEYTIRLAQELGATAWLNVPTQASDDFVRKMALLIKRELDPGKRFYVEYSNEVWNSAFPQHAYAVGEAARLGLPDADAFYVRRSLEIFKIFEDVFDGHSRFVRVLAGQAVNVHRTEKLLGYPRIGQRVDAYAIAPYFGYGEERVFAAGGFDPRRGDVDKVMARLEQDLARAQDTIRATTKLTRRAKLPLIAYEAGQHITSPPGSETFCAIINRDSRMESLYQKYIDIWMQETAGSLLLLAGDVFTYGRYGCWGLAETLDQDISEAPKLKAVRRYLEKGMASQ